MACALIFSLAITPVEVKGVKSAWEVKFQQAIDTPVETSNWEKQGNVWTEKRGIYIWRKGKKECLIPEILPLFSEKSIESFVYSLSRICTRKEK